MVEEARANLAEREEEEAAMDRLNGSTPAQLRGWEMDERMGNGCSAGNFRLSMDFSLHEADRGGDKDAAHFAKS